MRIRMRMNGMECQSIYLSVYLCICDLFLSGSRAVCGARDGRGDCTDSPFSMYTRRALYSSWASTGALTVVPAEGVSFLARRTVPYQVPTVPDLVYRTDRTDHSFGRMGLPTDYLRRMTWLDLTWYNLETEQPRKRTNENNRNRRALSLHGIDNIVRLNVWNRRHMDEWTVETSKKYNKNYEYLEHQHQNQGGATKDWT